MLKREHIPVGRENAISRPELCKMTGMGDRRLRNEIARLRRESTESDLVIVSTSDGSGYFRTDNLDEIRHFTAEMAKRISSTAEIIQATRTIENRLQKKRMYGKGLTG